MEQELWQSRGGVGINQAIQDLQPVSFDEQPKVEETGQQLQKEKQDLVQIQTTNSQEINSQTTKIQETQTQIQTWENQSNELKIKFEKIKAEVAELNKEITAKDSELEDTSVLQQQVQTLKTGGRETRTKLAQITANIIISKNQLKTQQATLGEIKKINSQELNKETGDVKTAEQKLQQETTLKSRQEAKMLKIAQNFQKSQQEVVQQKSQQEQEVKKILEEENQKILEAQKRLAELVAQNQAKKEAAQNQLGQISQEKITQTSQLILKTFESFGIKVKLVDGSKINQRQVTLELNGGQGGIQIAEKTIKQADPNIKFEIQSQEYGKQVIKINF